MSHDQDQATNVFRIPDLWSTSSWLDQLPHDNADSFFSKKLEDFTARPQSGPLNNDPPAKKEEEGFFKLPIQQPEELKEPVEQTSLQDPSTVGYEAESEAEDDIWLESSEPSRQQPPSLRTWETFIRGLDQSSQPMFLTEAGQRAYDALLSWSVDALELKNTAVPVIDTQAYFASLLSLVLGRESLLFLKSPDGMSFKPALSSMRISGHSANVLRGVEHRCLTCGRQLLELQLFVRKMYSKSDVSRCGVAFASAVDEVLRALQENTAILRASPRSLLQLQATIKGVSSVLAPLHGLTRRLGKNPTDEQLISLLFEHTCIVEISEDWLREMMEEILRRVSRPWTNFLEEWIGTRAEEGIPLSKSNVGQSKGFIKVEAEVFTDDMGDQVQEVDFRLDHSKVPSFMPEDITQIIFETGRILRFLRTAHPEHALARHDISSTTQPPEADWMYHWDKILQLESRVKAYRDRMLDTVEAFREGGMSSTELIPPTQLNPPEQPPTSLFTLPEAHLDEHIEASMKLLDTPMSSLKTKSTLQDIIRTRLGADRQPQNSHAEARPHWSLLPVLSFGSIASAQAQVVNRETLRQLFKHHDLRAHLDLQRDFHLFRNGQFSARLSHALFDPDLERADRQAGVARQGGIMGLRLGSRDTWPPASSELRLALMGVLVESYQALEGIQSESSAAFTDASDLPGGLSFAVRDLSEEEIDKCMNPDSLEALDFLRLSYKAPPALSFIITPLILIQYDRIFKLLLRVLRLVYVVDQLWRATATRNQEPEDVSLRFVREARHFITSVASYFLDTGIAMPWRAFERKLDGMQASLDERLTENLESPEQLREFHSNVLNTIMLALFLRKRQQPVLGLLEEVFTVILRYAKLARVGEEQRGEDNREGMSDLYRQFKRKVQVFITVCKGLSEKSRNGGSGSKGEDGKGGGVIGAEEGLGDESMVSQLLMRLDMNDYYAKH